MTDSGNTNPKTRRINVFMLGITEAWANVLFAASNAVLVVGAVLALVGTIGTILIGGVKEQFGNERLSANEARTAQAIADAEASRAAAAEAHARALEAQVELERYRSPRRLDAQQTARIIAAIQPFQGQQFSGLVGSAVPDARSLWVAISVALTKAGWKLEPPRGLSVGQPPAGVPVAPSEGVTVAVALKGAEKTHQAAKALAEALLRQKIKTSLGRHDEADRESIIVIEVGTKPL